MLIHSPEAILIYILYSTVQQERCKFLRSLHLKTPHYLHVCECIDRIYNYKGEGSKIRVKVSSGAVDMDVFA